MTRKTRGLTAVAIGLGLALTAGACAGSSSGGGGKSGSSGGGKVTVTFWENATNGPDGLNYFQSAAKQFEAAHPNVTIEYQTIQNEDLDGKLQTALNANAAPDIFLQRGGGKMQAEVDAGQLQALNLTDADKANLGAAVSALTLNGQVYGMPLDTQPEGVYYSQDLFKQAGIASTPTTMDELEADIAKLKAIKVAPIAVGAKDAWPAAHWYYNFALRECSQSTMASTAKSLKFDDPCWTKAGDDLAAFLKVSPFQDGFLTTAAQQGAGSSAGQLANHKAAMELMGSWDPGVIASLTPNQQPLPDLGWFPFPAVAGGQGDPSAIMGGNDAFSLSKNAPKEALEFLEFLATKDQQAAYAAAFKSIPVNQGAQAGVTAPYNVSALQAANKASYSMLFLDTQFGQNVGNAMNTAVVALMAGQGTSADIVSKTNAAAAKG
jgi:raffinose/stachyose/melibiose transport system substrate-binding protein